MPRRPPPQYMLGGYPLTGIVRRVRRIADLSQRELAERVRVSPALIAAIECGTRLPSLSVLQRILDAASLQLVAVDAEGRVIAPLAVWQDTEDGAGRRYPAHLDTILDPAFGEWWADGFGLARPPETFRRNREQRDYERQRSQWEVRVQQFRNAPFPRPPHDWRRADLIQDDEGWG